MKLKLLTTTLILLVASTAALAKPVNIQQVIISPSLASCGANNNPTMVTMNKQFLTMIEMNNTMMRNNCGKKDMRLNINLMKKMNKQLIATINMNNQMIKYDGNRYRSHRK